MQRGQKKHSIPIYNKHKHINIYNEDKQIPRSHKTISPTPNVVILNIMGVKLFKHLRKHLHEIALGNAGNNLYSLMSKYLHRRKYYSYSLYLGKLFLFRYHCASIIFNFHSFKMLLKN